MSQLSRQLVTYHGDSEDGDSEDEDENSTAKISDDSEPEKSEEVSAHQSPTGDLFRRTVTTSVKHVLVRPRIVAAPTVSLVSYDRDDEDNDEDSGEKEVRYFLYFSKEFRWSGGWGIPTHYPRGICLVVGHSLSLCSG